jgi:hypothetical protein
MPGLASWGRRITEPVTLELGSEGTPNKNKGTIMEQSHTYKARLMATKLAQPHATKESSLRECRMNIHQHLVYLLVSETCELRGKVQDYCLER